MSAVEIWGGVECTVNRVHDAYYSQLALSGHDGRPDDLALFAQLGIRRLRYPVLWELLAPDDVDRADWRWADERLIALRDLGIDPIVGLLHHGSGPSYTHLLDPAFPELFARYAAQVATRYPWVTHYTPINEPLTTARFSALYGLWYPHERSDRAFVKALLNQCRATVLAMRAIRRVNSGARLMQTDDLGQTFSTPRLQYQADFDNERRWLTWDLLCGKVNMRHPLRRYLEDAGASGDELDWHVANPCPPDIVGINHYVTSDRVLDHRLGCFAQRCWGGNGIDSYADTEAVRALPDYVPGFRRSLAQAWDRYSIPVALTEVHLGCVREEQLRWLHGAWRAAQSAASEGVNVVALTAWALLGSFNWDSLLTRDDGHYEPGAFDVRGGKVRPTALATAVARLAREGLSSHPRIVRQEGWWQRPSRIEASTPESRRRPEAPKRRVRRPLLIAGARGCLGRAFVRACMHREMPAAPMQRRELDICSPESIERALDEVRPWAVVNAAGYVERDDAVRDRMRCSRENVAGPVMLAAACARRDIPLLTFSSEHVFDGLATRPYVESSATNPVCSYGMNQRSAEQAIQRNHDRALIVRTSSIFGDSSGQTLLARALRCLATGGAFSAPNQVLSPTYAPDLAQVTLDLLIDAEKGIWHVVNRGHVSVRALIERAAATLQISLERLRDDSSAAPAYRPLTSERGLPMPSLEDALDRFSSSGVHRYMDGVDPPSP